MVSRTHGLVLGFPLNPRRSRASPCLLTSAGRSACWTTTPWTGWWRRRSGKPGGADATCRKIPRQQTGKRNRPAPQKVARRRPGRRTGPAPSRRGRNGRSWPPGRPASSRRSSRGNSGSRGRPSNMLSPPRSTAGAKRSDRWFDATGGQRHPED